MPDGPTVSVVVPCRNRAEYLRETIDSILTQSYPRIECIVMDGASTDGTINILRSYGSRIAWQSAPDGGPFDAINAGWDRSTGEVLAWLNADDCWTAGAVERAVAHLAQRPDADVIYGHCRGIDPGGRTVWWGEARPWDLHQALVGVDHIIHQPAAFIRRRAFVAEGPLRRLWVHDHDYWIRIALGGGRLAPVDEHLADGRIHPGNRTGDPATVVAARLELVARNFADPRLPEAWRRLEGRARSNVYVRAMNGLHAARPGDWPRGAALMAQAVREDWRNTPAGLGHAARLWCEMPRWQLMRLRAGRGA